MAGSMPTQWLSTLDLETVIATDLSVGFSENGIVFLVFGTTYREINSASEDDTVIKPVARIAVGVSTLSYLADCLTRAEKRITELQE